MSEEINETKKDKAEKTQISWSSLGGKLIATVPVTNEQVSFDPAELHESWKDFIVMYGIKQYVASNISSESFPLKEKASELMKLQPELTMEKAVEAVKLQKPAWLKEHAPALRTAIWKEMQALKVEKTKKEREGKETKAQVEARVKAETIAKMKATLKAGGLDDATIETMLAGV